MKEWMLGGLLVAASASAAVHNLRVPFDRLALLDGRQLAAGAIEKYDDIRGTVVAVSGRDMVTVPLAQLPEALVAAVRAHVPERSAQDLAAERMQAAKEAQAAKKRQEALEREQAREAKEIKHLSRAAKPSEADPVKRVETKVMSHAKSYFRTNSVVGQPNTSGYALVTIDITTTEPVAGWIGRYRTEGRATVEPVIQGSAYSQNFEVVAEIDAKNVVRIIDTKLVGHPE